MRVLGVFAHPDDETVCAGGTFARYADEGADVHVVSLTRGGAGQIRDARVATRATLRAVREQELHAAGQALGLVEARCLDLPDGGLVHLDPQVLLDLATGLLEEVRPDVVVTFGPDGFSGHLDHVAVGAAVTAACRARQAVAPVRLYHCHLLRSGTVLRDRLATWLVALSERFRGTQDFVQALTVFSHETTLLGYAADLVEVRWSPAGTYLLEQGEPATTMHFLLSGVVEVRREDEDGQVRLVDTSGPGEFVGEVGVATGRPRNAHVVARDDVTSLAFLPPGPEALPSGDRVDARVSTCIDVSAYVGHRLRATAAHRSQYPIDPDMFPEHLVQEMFGAEHFVQVLPERPLSGSLLED